MRAQSIAALRLIGFYAAVAADGTLERRPSVTIHQATSCLAAIAWSCTPRDPGEEGTIATGFLGLLRLGGLYVTIWDRNGRDPLAVARALRPV